jgi:NAD-dependent dihydropyrimidine dehydrogenase PreA subunit
MNAPASRDSCATAAGTFAPQVDRNRCEGKGACVSVCPEGVFVVDRLPPELRTGLTWRGRLKGFAHRWQQALVAHPSACAACARCVSACPESAITLVRTARSRPEGP